MWAEKEVRSVNQHIEYLLTTAIRERNRNLRISPESSEQQRRNNLEKEKPDDEFRPT